MLRHLEDPATAWKTLWVFIFAMLALAIARGMLISPRAMEVSSFFILLVTAFICMRIYAVRRPPDEPGLRSPARIWLFVGLGFLYLAADEALSFHEEMDNFIHWLFGIQETALTDRLDDAIVLVYGIAGAIVIYFHRDEFWRLGKHKGLIATGFLFLVLMVILDGIGNRPDVLLYFGLEDSTARRAQYRLDFLEEFLKLPAECAFLIAFARVYESASEPLRLKTSGATANPPLSPT